MPALTSNEVNTQGMVRVYYQFGGPRADAQLLYYGVDGQYGTVQGLTMPYGDIDPVNVPDPFKARSWRRIQRTRSAPGNIEATLMLYEKRGTVPRNLGKQGCVFNLYMPVGSCGDLSDINGWESYIDILSYCEATSLDGGDRGSFDSDDALANTYSLVMADAYKVGPIALGEAASQQIQREIIGQTFGAPVACEGCEPSPADWIYLLVADDIGSGAVTAQVLYSTDGGLTFSASTITGIGVNEQVKAITTVGGYLLVLGTGGYYIALLDAITGVPGTWSHVTTGFAVGGTPNDVYAASPRAIYFCGQGGYLYKATDVTSGVSVLSAAGATSENLTRIHGQGDTVVAVGANGTVVRSVNSGQTWSTTTAPAAVALTALAVRSANVITVGTADGRVFDTNTGGATAWVEKTFLGSGEGAVQDILYATDEVGYIAKTTAGGTAQLLATWNGGHYWFEGPRRFLSGTPVAARFNRIAVPLAADSQTAANTVAVGGLAAGGGTDGVFFLGIAAQL